MKVDSLAIIEKYYPKNSKAYSILIYHGKLVRDRSLTIARNLKDSAIDMALIEAGAMLHDIGMFKTNVSKFGCNGAHHYIRHGILGRELMEKEGFFKIALICERHVGVGLSKQNIIDEKLPLPSRDMIPLSIEEQIICFADKFFSKSMSADSPEKNLQQIKKGLHIFGKGKIAVFEKMLENFSPYY